MNRSDVPSAFNPAFKDWDGYEWIEFGKTTRVVSQPYCRGGCRKFAGKGKPAPRIRLVRIWNSEFQHWSLKCWKCKKVWASWI